MTSKLQNNPNSQLEQFESSELNQDEKQVLNIIEKDGAIKAETVSKKLQTEYHIIEGVIHDLLEKDKIRKASFVKNRYGSKIPKYEAVNL